MSLFIIFLVILHLLFLIGRLELVVIGNQPPEFDPEGFSLRMGVSNPARYCPNFPVLVGESKSIDLSSCRSPNTFEIVLWGYPLLFLVFGFIPRILLVNPIVTLFSLLAILGWLIFYFVLTRILNYKLSMSGALLLIFYSLYTALVTSYFIFIPYFYRNR